VPATDPPFDRIGIVGLGLIGGSLALAIRRVWPGVAVIGVDRADVAAKAIDRRVVDLSRASIGDLTDTSLVVIATPVLEIPQLLDDAARAGCSALLTDVGSTKRHVMAAAEGAGLAFIGGHPVAGSALGGLDHARESLFDGRPWLLVPGTAATPALERLERFVCGVGAVPQRIQAETHDRLMAYVSHLPQLVSSALMGTAGLMVGDAGLSVSGRGFADMTRLASSPPEIWEGILSTNADYVAEAASALVAALPTTPRDLRDAPKVTRLFQSAHDWLDRLSAMKSRHGAA
jgi:prephenate dehydrogenase